MLKDIKARDKYFDNVGHRHKEKLKAGYSFQKTPGATAVYTQGPTKSSGRWKNNGPNVPNTYKKTSGNSGITIYKTGSAPKPAAPAPKLAAAEPIPEPTGISDKLQAAYDFKKSGSNFASNTQAERKELTDSFKQNPSYDPQAGIASPEAGKFLDDYKLNLQSKIDTILT